MSRDSVCGKCSQSIDHNSELYTFCEGDCARFFHLSCACLSEKEVAVLRTNYIWLCDECLLQFQRARDSKSNNDVKGSGASPVMTDGTNVKSMEDEINALKGAVSSIMDTLASFNRADSLVDPHPPLRHSTPVSSSVLLHGSNEAGIVVINDEVSEQQCATNDDCFSLLLTNIDVSVDESDVQQMVAQALGMSSAHPEYIDVAKLVPKWRSCNTMDYVSFKVILNNRLKFKAMNPSTWPKGIKFREFIKRQTVTWKPVL